MGKTEKQTSKGKAIIFITVVTVLFLAAMTLVGATLMGVNVFEEAQKITAELTGDKSTTAGDPLERQVLQLKGTIANHELDIETLQEELKTKNLLIEDLKKSIATYEAKIAEYKEDAQANESTQQSVVTFLEMSPKNAAAIIAVMKNEDAHILLKDMQAKDRAAILEKMSPDRAAELAKLFIQ